MRYTNIHSKLESHVGNHISYERRLCFHCVRHFPVPEAFCLPVCRLIAAWWQMTSRNCHFNSHSQTSEEASCTVSAFELTKIEWRGVADESLSFPEELLMGRSQKNPISKASQCNWRSHTLWTYGQSPIVCCSIYGWVACHLFCLSETSMTPVWILNKKGFFFPLRLWESCCHLILPTPPPSTVRLLFSRDWQMRLFLAMKICSLDDCQVTDQKPQNQRVVEASMCICTWLDFDSAPTLKSNCSRLPAEQDVSIVSLLGYAAHNMHDTHPAHNRLKVRKLPKYRNEREWVGLLPEIWLATQFRD